jgi:hypothetical protein
MSNTDTPFGLKPVRHLNGSPWNGAVKRCYLPSTDGTAMFIGDPVDLAGSSDGLAVAPTVVKATAGAENPIYGVIVSFEPDPTNLSLIYRTASTARYCYVCVDPSVIYEIQGCSGAALGATTVGLNAVLIYTHSGSTVTGLSGVEMDSGAATAPAADENYQLMILNAVDREDNDFDAANAKWEVLIGLHRLTSHYTGAAQVGPKGV